MKKCLIATVAVFIVWMAGGFVIHGMLLHDDYAQVANLFRPEAEAKQYCWLMLVAQAIMASAFVWIYKQGVEDKPWLQQGLRYGLAIALLTTVPLYTMYFVIQPVPGALVVKQIIGDSIFNLIVGAIVAFIYRPRPQSA